MASKYLKEFEKLNTTTDSIYDLGEHYVLIILKDGTNLTSWNNVENKKEIIYISEDLTGRANFLRKYKGLSNLKSIVALGVGNKVKNMPNMSGMFEGCTSLADISSLSDWDTSQVNTMAMMFAGCTSLTDLTPLSNWKIGSTYMYEMFRDCTSLSDLSPLSNWDLSRVRSMSHMFAGCTSLVDVSATFGWKGAFKGNAFDNCPNIKEYPDWYREPKLRSGYNAIRENPQRKKVFKAFKDEDTLTPKEIGEKEDISPSTIRTNLNMFLEKELVYITNPESKRNRKYKLTENGKKVMSLLK